MRASASLRWRMVLAAGIFGAVLSTTFALVANWITEEYEHILLDEILRVDADSFAARIRTNPAAALPESRRIHAYFARSGPGDAPAEFAGLVPGIHELELEDGTEQHVAVYDIGGSRLYFAMELGQVEAQEDFLAKVMLAVVGVGTTLSLWIGWLLANRVLGPVAWLAREVAAREPGRPYPSLAPQFADDELGRLAKSFDEYEDRLATFAERERAFAADTSHGLRTPIAVIQGAVDVLLDSPQLDPATRSRVERIERGSGTLADLMDALFAIARSASPERLQWAPCDVGAVVQQALVAQERLLRESGVVATVTTRSTAATLLPLREFDAFLRLSIRCLVEAAASGVLSIVARTDGIELSTAEPTAVVAGPRAPDRSVGLGLLSRLCLRIGWLLEIDDDSSGVPVRIALRFGT